MPEKLSYQELDALNYEFQEQLNWALDTIAGLEHEIESLKAYIKVLERSV